MKRIYEPILMIPFSIVMVISSQLSGPIVSNAVKTLMGVSAGNESRAVLSVPAVQPFRGAGGVIVRFSGGKQSGHSPTYPGTKHPANWQVQWSEQSWQLAQTWTSCFASVTANHHPHEQFNGCDVGQRNNQFASGTAAGAFTFPLTSSSSGRDRWGAFSQPSSPHPLPLARSRQRLGHFRCLLPTESLMAVVHSHRAAGEHQRLTRLGLQANGLLDLVPAGGNV